MSSSKVKWWLFAVLIIALLLDFTMKSEVFEEEEHRVENPLYFETVEMTEEIEEVMEEVFEEAAVLQEEIIAIEDRRDGTEYPVLKINDVRWMIQNLSYDTEGAVCYDLASYCDNVGKLYTYEAALRACPDGWRLPKKREWEYLIKHYLDRDAFPIQGQILDAATSVGLTMGGVRRNDGQFINLGEMGYYWSQLDYDVDTAFGYQFSEDYQLIGGYQNKYAKDWQLSCLCVQSN